MLNQYTRYATVLLLLTHAELILAGVMEDITLAVTATQTDLSFRASYERYQHSPTKQREWRHHAQHTED